MSIRIEILYSEVANLFAELQNVNYLKKCIPDAEMIYTSLDKAPAFAGSKVNLVYMGAMSEKAQELVIEALRPFKETIEQEIDLGTVFLFTGNAMEVMERYIENEDGSRVEALGIFDVHAKRQMMHRYNSLMLGSFEGMKLVGFKSQFSHTYGNNENCYFYDVVRGDGICPGSTREGLRKGNFFGTYTVGPLLVLNPDFTLWLQKLMGVKEPKLAFEDAARAAYTKRLAEFENPKTKLE